ncbi:polyketide cyclase/dehydrase [Mycolicibacterium mageritense DSM 44476 = CIP 104973]|uniref:Polyketide cyclase n=1 Tax=Mycolicibacterium mageritense TaxID=53462 RepID=A0AAI8XR65_MYCME|nr:SRPBCC family protein [Mycolicibacterium mageritense]MBN3456768.1 SRPBCC family protein [Mycobacterium sp. DSM 3803]MCC9186637.1 SRPBCC family protein [Mycolicibacterium mageritense]TXI62692.1 MAG: SRPBCC family protein [Mycolicibacterium mageritense]CDO26415.1 cyclase/dehydrase [Mycolicibacterium mageritense DSM 44476 = CIP 104973]BBX36784.1 polyketide cyclase [Mycolicibacterium mageritense]
MATTFKALLERRITVDATPSVVWGIVRDVRRMPEWSPQVVSVKMRDPDGDIRLGSAFTNLNRQDELEWITHGEVVRYVPGEEIAFRIAENYTIWSFSISPYGDDGTVLTQRRETPDGISQLSLELTESHLGGQQAFTELLEAGMERTLSAVKACAES